MAKAQPPLESARHKASQELTLWPAGCNLRHSPELSTPDMEVFLVISAVGRNCGSVAVTDGGGVIRRVASCAIDD